MERIETPRLILRRFTPDDAPRVAQICNDEHIYRSTLSLPHPYPLECAQTWIAAQDALFAQERQYDFAVIEKASGTLCGSVSVSHDQAHRHGELGYWIAHECWNHGYATEAARALIDFCLREKGYHRVYARHFASNPASGRVMQKLGMTREGVQKEHLCKAGRWEDVVLYGLTVPGE